MYYDPTNAIVSSCCLGRAVVIMHRLSGGYLAESGDLQIKQHPTLTGDPEKDKKALWILHANALFDAGTVLYRIQNVGNGKYLSLPKGTGDPTGKEMTYADKHDPQDDDDNEYYNQLFALQPVEGKSHLISPAKWPDKTLGNYNNDPAGHDNVCDRPPPWRSSATAATTTAGSTTTGSCSIPRRRTPSAAACELPLSATEQRQ